MQPANLSAKKEISFWAKGVPRRKEFTFPLAAFQGVDAHVIMGVVFCGGPAPGRFEFELDDVRFR